ncbi:MAG: 4-alpha-glucanotransferase, partial [Anaerovoracaceae bacterium]
MKKETGILANISSLPSPFGIGVLGKEAIDFAKTIKGLGFDVWQTLPVTHIGGGNSPYSAFSAFAGNPYYIDPRGLLADGFLSEDDINNELNYWEDIDSNDKVLYGLVQKRCLNYMAKAFTNYSNKARNNKSENNNINLTDSMYQDFCKKNAFWLDDYAAFMTSKMSHLLNFDNFFSSLKGSKSELCNDDFWKFVQYIFFKQWGEFKNSINEFGVKIFGDIPFYLATDSAEGKYQSELFLPMDYVGGCPPEDYAKDGQVWNTPLYDWKSQKENGYD